VTLTAVGATEFTGSGDFTFDVDYDPQALPDAEVTVTVSEQGGEDDTPKRQPGRPARAVRGEPDLRLSAAAHGARRRSGDDRRRHRRARQSFANLNGCRVELRDGTEYVAGSFNIGAPGGEAWDADGLWAGNAPAGFIQYGDNMITFYKDSIEGYDRYDFNVTPVDGVR